MTLDPLADSNETLCKNKIKTMWRHPNPFTNDHKGALTTGIEDT